MKELRNQLEASESKVHSLLEQLKKREEEEKVHSLLEQLNTKREEEEGRRMQSDQRMKQLESQVQSLETENSSLQDLPVQDHGAELSQQMNELIRDSSRVT